MKAIITINRRDALVQGLDNEGDYPLTFDPADLNPEQRVELALSKEDGGAFVVNNGNYGSFFLNPENLTTHQSGWPSIDTINASIKPTSADMDTLRRLLDARIKARAELVRIGEKLESDKHQKIYNAMKIFINLPPEKQVTSEWTGWGRSWRIAHLRESKYDSLGKVTDWAHKKNLKLKVPGAQTVIAEFKAAVADAESLIFWVELDEMLADRARKREHEAAKRIKLAEEAAAKKRRKAQLRRWVAEMSDPVDQKRFQQGYLSEEEILAQIRDQVFSGLEGWPRYRRIKASDVCDYPAEHDVEWEVSEDKGSKPSQAEYMQIVQMEKALDQGIPYHPGAKPRHIVEATVTPRRHFGKCVECNRIRLREDDSYPPDWSGADPYEPSDDDQDVAEYMRLARLGFMVRIKVGELNFSREYGFRSPDEG